MSYKPVSIDLHHKICSIFSWIFTIIAGGVLGGIKMEGGGRMSSIVVGVLILTVLTNGMQLMQLGVYPQYIVKGFVLVLAICFDSLESFAAIRRAKLIKD